MFRLMPLMIAMMPYAAFSRHADAAFDFAAMLLPPRYLLFTCRDACHLPADISCLLHYAIAATMR